MKTTILLGSPRPKSNSTAIARRLGDQLRQRGTQVDLFELNKLKYRGCQGCMACKTRYDHCGLKDDLSPVLDSVKNADVLVLASAVYYGDVTSQLKGCIDRFYSFYVPEFWKSGNPSRLTGGKQLVFILTQGSSDENEFAGIDKRYGPLISILGYAKTHLLRFCGIDPEMNALENPQIISQTDSLAMAL